MEGYALFKPWYFNGAHNDPNISPNIWSSKVVQMFQREVKRENWKFFDYRVETESMVTALKAFPAKGHGLVVGSLMPWLEAILLLHGASNITTAEYHPTNNSDPRLNVIHPIDMAKQYNMYLEKFDFGASFSSLEHSGLGRYGDNLDPAGDLIELEKIRCFLKPNATLYLSIPLSIDRLYWNGARLYGMARYPMIIADFEILGIFRHKTQFRDGFKIDWVHAGAMRHVEPVMVLRQKLEKECL